MNNQILNWPNILTGIGTLIMAIGVIITSIYAFRNWSKSLKKDTQDMTVALFKEFSNNAQIETGIWLFSFSKEADSIYEINAKEMILFFAKMGKLLKDEIISLENIENYFYNYLFFEERMLNIINNLKSLSPKIPKDYINNFNFLMNKISETSDIKSYKDIVYKSFNPIRYDDFVKIYDKNTISKGDNI